MILKAFISFAAFTAVLILAQASQAAQGIQARVLKVVDGDSIVVSNIGQVRYIGIDAPEYKEPYFNEAKERNSDLVLGKRVSIVVCRDEERDKYSRVLAWVYVDGASVNDTLLREGLAQKLVIPPCGLERIKEISRAEAEAKRFGRGIWGKEKKK